eukprot:s1032_g7.t1
MSGTPGSARLHLAVLLPSNFLHLVFTSRYLHPASYRLPMSSRSLSFQREPGGSTTIISSSGTSEFMPLFPHEGSLELGGWKLQDYGERWHYVFVFPADTEDAKNADYWTSEMPDASGAWDRIFTQQYNTAQMDFLKPMTRTGGRRGKDIRKQALTPKTLPDKA